MKATTRILALLLVAVLMIGMFAGCGPKVPNTTTGGNNTTTKGPDATTAAPTTVNKTNKHEVTVLVQNSIGGEYDMNKVYDLEIWKKIEELMGAYGVTIKLQIVETDQYATTLQTTLAGNKADIPDLMFAEGGQLSETLRVQAIESGLLTAVQDCLVYSDGTASAGFEANPLYFARSAYNGKNYWFGEYQVVEYDGEYQGIGMGAPSGINIREDWMNELGMTEVPDTLEGLADFIRACRKADVNGTGVEDEVFSMAITGFSSCAYLCEWFGVPYSELVPNLKTGKVDSAWETEGIKDMFKLMLEWLDEGLIPIDALGTKSQSPWYKQNKAALYGTYFCNNWSINAQTCPVPEGDATPNLVGVIPNKELYPNAYIYHDASPTMDNRIMMIGPNADKEAIGHILDVLASEEWQTLLNWGVEGWSYKVNDDGSKELINGAEAGHTALATPGSAVAGRPVISFGMFAGGFFGVYDLLEDEAACDSDLELEIFREGMTWECVYPGQYDGYLAIATPEEEEVINEYYTDFEMLSDELLMKILLGEISLDNWDAEVIAPLKEAGLDQLKEAYQSRFDRYFEAYQATLEG